MLWEKLLHIKIDQELEKEIDEKIESLLTNPSFLLIAGSLINLNSYRKIWLNQALRGGWKFLQLPNKSDQERTLQLLQSLHDRISQLESAIKELSQEASSKNPLTAPLPPVKLHRVKVHAHD